ncbi:MAG TPA: AraC family transcriptional regulator [Planctomycetota bacterium]|nr:AraC family transcriptional regulator [Planctomycetota bacterium]
MIHRYHGSYPEFGLRYFRAFHDCPARALGGVSHIGEMVCERTRTLPEHTHDGYEVCYVASGRLRRDIAGRRVLVGPREFFISRPREAHGGGPEPSGPCHYFSVGFDPEGVLAAGRPELAAALAERTFAGSRAAERVLRRLLDEIERLDHADDGDAVLGQAMVHALLIEFAVILARCHRAARARGGDRQAPAGPADGAFEPILRWLATRLASPPSLAEMAARAGLSRAHFCAAFRRAVGVAPVAYLTRARIDAAAQRLIDSDLPVGEIADALGFSSPQRFATTFRRVRRCMPREWRQRHR